MGMAVNDYAATPSSARLEFSPCMCMYIRAKYTFLTDQIVCVGLCLCTYIHTYIHTHAYIHTYLHTYTDIHTYISVRHSTVVVVPLVDTHMRGGGRAYMSHRSDLTFVAFSHACVCLCVCVCEVSVFVYIHTYTHTYIHTYIHTYKHKQEIFCKANHLMHMCCRWLNLSKHTRLRSRLPTYTYIHT